ncbi:3,4-dihydroxy-2-butanone-4-phosphate synthase [Leucobacter chromiireducens]|uniref:3,4-dihydroxy-2-butanone 4-phosphate synthase n=1 Tax=Leucobacter chromiireducens subsp. chromiireducens TaxID=660067 RepID=A0ABS1SR18_9MICO|nr:3,4-dihydroxy-2-butanone-4-phosphate synthase [Leucobacter chromiireducens]MBL3689567.1 3,4-dihydroxy-2-butanone-4-phosphate synthase [Leucobacter chromiireducens subsp. chromiireducens]
MGTAKQGVAAGETSGGVELSPISEVLARFAAGDVVLVADDDARENEVDAIVAAELATPATIGWMVRYTSGLLCAPMAAERADALGLPAMVERNEDPRGTAYTVTVDARTVATTGISASDRACTVRMLADPVAGPGDLIRPGHILPLRAHPLGTHGRGGHTEAAVDLARMAGLESVGVLAELVDDVGEMLRLGDVLESSVFAGMAVTTVAEIARASQSR